MRPVRNRLRRASSGLPGYDNLGWDSFGHPASLEQPAVDEYGIDSEFGEGVRKGPYRSGPAPASYGWQPDHPAAKESLVEDFAETEELYEANIKKAMERKASKCIAIAESRLGKFASQQEIEDLALRYMDLPSRTLNAKFSRVASTFLAEDAMQEATGYAGGDFGPGNVMADDEGDLLADQNDPSHFYSDEMLAEEEEAGMDSDLVAHTIHDEYDMDDDGVVSRDEWGGSESVFNALDTKMDGFLDDEELAVGVGASFSGVGLEDEDEMGFEDEMVSPAMNLAEEIANLKKANVRLARQIRKFAEDSVQEATGYVGVDESVDVLDMEESDGPAPRLASTNRFASRLAELSSLAEEAQVAGDDEAMAEILAEMSEVSAAYRRHNPYGEALHGFGYQDPDIRYKHRTQQRSMMPKWDAETKRLHNQEYYQKHKHLWAEQRRNRRMRRLEERGLPMDFEGRMPRMPRMADDMGYDEFGGVDEFDGVDAMESGAFADLLAEMEDMAGEEPVAAKGHMAAKKHAEEDLSEDEEAMLAEMVAELEEEAVASKKASAKKSSVSLKAALKARTAKKVAEEEEAEEEEAEEEEAEDAMGLSGKTAKIDPKLARIFAAAEEEAEEEEADEEEIMMAEEEPVASKSKKSASTKTRQASVKTLGNLSREASSSSDELSKLWESAPDVSKYFS